MGQLIAIGNLKGGTGKSTIAVNLACAFAGDDRSVVLIDADAQGTTTDWHAGHRLPVAVRTLPLSHGQEAAKWVTRALDLRAENDLVVVDLPPHLGSGIASALLIADVFVIPVTPSGVDLRATGRALELFRRTRLVRSGSRPAALLVPSRVDRRTVVGRRIDRALERFGLQVGPAIRQRAAFVEAFDAGCWIGAHAPGSAAHHEITLLKRRVEAITAGLEATDAAVTDASEAHAATAGLDAEGAIPSGDGAAETPGSSAAAHEAEPGMPPLGSGKALPPNPVASAA